MITVLICGGRNLDPGKVCNWLLVNFTRIMSERRTECRKIVTGGAAGADAGAELYARNVALPLAIYPANWARYYDGAGPKRNLQMIVDEKPDLVIAFPGSDGTANMITQATKFGIPVLTIEGV